MSASDEKCELLVETISLRVGEAKHLHPPQHELRAHRDSFVVVALDREEIFRTAVAEKTNCPFYGEEFEFQVPRDFQRLSFYVYDAAAGLSRDVKLGRVAIPKADLLLGGRQGEQWHSIRPADGDSESQGRVEVEVCLSEQPVGAGPEATLLTVCPLHCIGLSTLSGAVSPDPFCEASVLTSSGWSEAKHGQVKRRTVDPVFMDAFEFTLKSCTNVIIKLCVWHQARLTENVFLGEINLSLGPHTLPPFSWRSWYHLSPREVHPTSPSSVPPPLGSLRVNACYQQEYLHPIAAYEPLRDMLVQGLEQGDLANSVLFILSSVHKNRSAMAKSAVKVFLKLGKLDLLMRTIIEAEVSGTSDPNTLFRGNSLTSKVIDEFMKLVGRSYLQRTLQSCIDEIFDTRRSCEIDASRVSEGENLQVNMANLLFFVEKILSAITASALSCPQAMCRVFALLKEAAVKRFPEQRETVQYTAVSGFVFLRFFAPAILNPKLFHLRPEYASPVVSRALTLISKTIQNISNINTNSEQRSSLHLKEGFMSALNAQIMDQTHIKNVKDYLTAISDPRGGQECLLSDTVYREGFLVKRSQGRKRGPKNFRNRHFCLTDRHLEYSKGRGEAVLCSIPSADLLAVERVDEEAFGMKFMFQVVQPSRVLYLQAKSSVDLMEWLYAFSKVCSHSLTLFHSGAYLNGVWTCCKYTTQDISTGCKAISLAIKLMGQREDIDLRQELHKLYLMFLECQTSILKLKEEAAAVAREEMNGSSSTDLPERLKVLCELSIFVKNLELSNSALVAKSVPQLGSKDKPFSCGVGEAHIIG